MDVAEEHAHMLECSLCLWHTITRCKENGGWGWKQSRWTQKTKRVCSVFGALTLSFLRLPRGFWGSAQKIRWVDWAVSCSGGLGTGPHSAETAFRRLPRRVVNQCCVFQKSKEKSWRWLQWPGHVLRLWMKVKYWFDRTFCCACSTSAVAWCQFHMPGELFSSWYVMSISGWRKSKSLGLLLRSSIKHWYCYQLNSDGIIDNIWK